MDSETSSQDRARDGLQHLQAAARELIQAARALLDVAEDLVEDPAALATLAGAAGAVGDAVRRRAAAAPHGGADDVDDGVHPDTTIERIAVG
jgi:hypothetical protein